MTNFRSFGVFINSSTELLTYTSLTLLKRQQHHKDYVVLNGDQLGETMAPDPPSSQLLPVAMRVYMHCTQNTHTPCSNTCWQTLIHTGPNVHTSSTNTHIHIQKHVLYAHICSYIQPFCLPLSLSHTHTCQHSQTHSLTHLRTRTHYPQIQSHMQRTYTHTFTCTRSYAHTY